MIESPDNSSNSPPSRLAINKCDHDKLSPVKYDHAKLSPVKYDNDKLSPVKYELSKLSAVSTEMMAVNCELCGAEENNEDELRLAI